MAPRKRSHSHRGMHKKMVTGRKPMTPEEKATRKKNREAQSEADKKRIATAKK